MDEVELVADTEDICEMTIASNNHLKVEEHKLYIKNVVKAECNGR